jgi:hypothetical protein
VSAFNDGDERTIQSTYLLNGILNNPILGSGFGGYAGYQRSDVRPWLYELTYLDNFFHFGIPLSIFLFATIYYYIFNAIFKKYDGSRFYVACIGYGVFNFMIGIWSNPYMGSFDFLLQISLLPLLVAHDKFKQNSNCHSFL